MFSTIVQLYNRAAGGRVAYISWDELEDKQEEEPKGCKDTRVTPMCHPIIAWWYTDLTNAIWRPIIVFNGNTFRSDAETCNVQS